MSLHEDYSFELAPKIWIFYYLLIHAGSQSLISRSAASGESLACCQTSQIQEKKRKGKSAE
jgi:hypothetical protein